MRHHTANMPARAQDLPAGLPRVSRRALPSRLGRWCSSCYGRLRSLRPSIPQLQLGQERVVEVVRLYVDPDLRRTGLASQLVAALKRMAQNGGVEQMYLRTHPFLLGAVSFWERHGFSIVYLSGKLFFLTELWGR